MRNWSLVAVLAATIVLVSACGSSEDTSQTSPTSDDVEVADPGPDTPATGMVIELVDCAQLGTNTGVDPAVAAGYVLAGQDLYLDDVGDARFALITKSCTDIVVDGTSTGPGHFNTAWVRIAGPEETRSFDDPSVGIVLPTDYFRPVLLQTDNADYARATQEFGVSMTLADEMAFDDPQLGTQVITSSDTEVDPPLNYTLTAENDSAFPEGVIGVVHVLEGTDGDGRSLTFEIECLAEGGFRGSATLAVEPGASFEELIGSGFEGPASGPGINCEVTITRGD